MLLHAADPTGGADGETKPRWAPRWLLLATAIAMILAGGGTAGPRDRWRNRGHNQFPLPKPPLQAPKPRRPPAETTAPATDSTAAPDGEAYQVALIYPGTADDLSWSNAWWDGAEQAMEVNPEHHGGVGRVVERPGSGGPARIGLRIRRLTT